MVARFFGRQAELATLDRAYRSRNAEMALVYGRRRIGKSYLLQAFIGERRGIIYQATRQTAALELRAFTEEVRRSLGPKGLPTGYVFPSWEDALTFIADNADRRFVVIIDEFPYLRESTIGLESVLQRWWDMRGRNSRIMLVLCGSALSVMHALDGYTAPLHQRFTTKLHVGPVSYLDAAEFTPQLNFDDLARVYGIVGGTPFYLDCWDQAKSVKGNVAALLAHPAGVLFEAANLILSTDVDDATAPYRVLQAIGQGATRWNDIKSRSGITTTRVLDRLLDIGLISRRVPAMDNPERSKRGIYAIADPYLRFYFRFIAMNRGPITRGLGEQVVDEQIMPYLDDHMGGVFEEMARAYCTREIKRGALKGDDVGSWWSTDGQHEIDVVGTARRVPTFVGSVKWRGTALDRRVLADLERDVVKLGFPKVQRLLIGRAGARKELLANVRSVSIEDMYS